MRITPLDIRQKAFEKNFRGYQIDEVNAFLLTLSQEWERILDENKELRIKLEGTEREVTKLREVESSLYKTLKTAEDTGAHVIEQARQTAELHLKESQMKADAMLHEAKSKAKDTIEESEMRAKELVADMEDRLKSLIDSYKKLETTREDLLNDLRRLGNETIERVERAKQHTKDFDADQHLNFAKREAKKIAFPNSVGNFERLFKPELKAELKAEPEKTVIEQEIILEHQTIIIEPPQPKLVETPQPKKVQKSFFDEIA